MQIFRCQQAISLLLFRQAPEPAQLSIHLIQRLSFLGIKQPGREANYSPSSVAVKNTWRYAYTPAMCLHSVHDGNFLESKSSLVVFRVALCFSMLLTLTAWLGRVKSGHLVWIS